MNRGSLSSNRVEKQFFPERLDLKLSQYFHMCESVGHAYGEYAPTDNETFHVWVAHHSQQSIFNFYAIEATLQKW